jgi:hypothetical protein
LNHLNPCLHHHWLSNGHGHWHSHLFRVRGHMLPWVRGHMLPWVRGHRLPWVRGHRLPSEWNHYIGVLELPSPIWVVAGLLSVAHAFWWEYFNLCNFLNEICS